MIYTQTPFRLSFFGGGTDHQPFFNEHGGCVLSTTINKYCYTSLRRCPPFFDYHTRVRYSRTEDVRKTEELVHPLVRNCMMHMGVHNLSIIHEADLPARSGLGSSSSFAVGLLQALNAFKGKYASKQQLAEDAIYVERELCNESGGWQDQVAVAYGGFNRIDFYSDSFSVSPIVITSGRKKELEEHLMMFFTGISRFSDVAASAQMAAIGDNVSQLLEMKSLVNDAIKIIGCGSDIVEFGKLLDYTWKLKRGLSDSISSDYIDEIYTKAKNAGAIGGKLMGAGGGGFMVLFVAPDNQASVREALHDFVYVPFEFEEDGSKIIHYTQEEYEYYTE